MSGKVVALVGGQFGSEGKGLIAEKIGAEFGVSVRTGAPNAGHTYFVDAACDHSGVELQELYGTGREEYPPAMPTLHGCPRCGDTFPNIGDTDAWGIKEYRAKVVARSVPVGAAFHSCELIVGAGAFIDLGQLIEEIEQLDALGLQVSGRLLVDSRATLIDPVRHHQFEGGVDGHAHRMIGSTGEGVGPARMGKISRGTLGRIAPAWATVQQAGEVREQLEAAGCHVCDTAQFLNDRYDRGGSILLEGTQGSGLSLVHGPWPFCTSTDTNAAALAMDAGLAPQMVNEVILVVRTFPIRVAGNSGPLPLEVSWKDVGQPEERTTVTKKMRRVAHFYPPTVRRAVMLNRPSEIALTFVDYVWPGLRGLSGRMPVPPPDGLLEWLRDKQSDIGVPITMLGTGPDTVIHRVIGGRFPISGPWPNADEAYGLRSTVAAT